MKSGQLTGNCNNQLVGEKKKTINALIFSTFSTDSNLIIRPAQVKTGSCPPLPVAMWRGGGKRKKTDFIALQGKIAFKRPKYLHKA